MRVGIFGAGQLGQMLALAGIPLGLQFRFLDPAPESPAGQIAEQILKNYDDTAAIDRLCEGADVVTYEFENIPAAAARQASELSRLWPSIKALEESQDRLREKLLFQKVGIETASFAPVDTPEQFDSALKTLGLPAVLKTRRFGYDGKGQSLLRTAQDAETARAELDGTPRILEGFVSFEREVSLVATRWRNGRLGCWPLVENHHREGILRLTIAPMPGWNSTLQQEAETAINALTRELDYVGTLAIEFFVKDGHLIANEMAPRVHNSGHWTQDGAYTSQFENHLRAILDLPPGNTVSRCPTAMLNLIGEVPPTESLLAIPGAHLHLYGKEPRPGRKLGHLNLTADNIDILNQRISAAQERIK